MINILNLGLKESLGITFEDDILREKCSNAVFFFWSVFSPNTGKYGPEKPPCLDTFHAVPCVELRLRLSFESDWCVCNITESGWF